MMKDGFTVLKMEAADPEPGDICVDPFWAARKAQQNVRRYIVAQRNGQSQKLSQGHIDTGIRILVLQWTVDVWQDAVLRKEPHRLIQRKRAFLDLMQTWAPDHLRSSRQKRRRNASGKATSDRLYTATDRYAQADLEGSCPNV